MNKELLTFILNNHAKIIIQLHYPEDIIDASYDTRLYFIYYNHRYLLSYFCLRSNISEFKKILNKALNNKLQLTEYFAQNIGYYWNNALNKKNTSEKFGADYYALKYYTPWYSDQCIWIYNDQYKNIILEITPLYPYTYAYKKRKPSYNYFLKWMQKYKPIYKQIISKDIVQQWIDQATEILNEIDKNTEELYAQGKF
jgi:hypothetical protein